MFNKYETIKDLHTNKNVSIFSRQGKRILKKLC